MRQKKKAERPKVGDSLNVEGCHKRFRPTLVRYEGGKAIVRSPAIGSVYVYDAWKVSKAKPLSKTSKKSQASTASEGYD